MDAGMSNNLPIYPLLRPGREVDIVIAFDASADIRTENWLSVADGYARQRGIRGWPVGTGWPKGNSSPADNAAMLEAAEASSPQEADDKVAAVRESRGQHDAAAQPPGAMVADDGDLGYCNVWVGTTEERSSEEEPPPSKRNIDFSSPDWKLMEPNAGITVIYFPLIKNEEVPGVDPEVSDYLSTWNFVYTPEHIDGVVALAKANFKEGQRQTKDAVRAVYEKKRRARLKRWGEEASMELDMQGDHFS
jgi:phospholipase A2